ncbi:methyltransferase domain-containing protein [Desulfovibrio sp. OttesenSCG-928-C06]|nr:methyltransferase domain-containing protein [Desulfovibrio sp. OttesenSCG-928-C06]
MTVNKARSYFPRGLFQPAGSFRFSMDALLLASFAVRCLELDAQLPGSSLSNPEGAPEHMQSMLDLGCGCGVVAFGVMLQIRNMQGYGVDIQPELLEASTKNASLLGLESRYSGICADLTMQNAPFSLTDTVPGELSGRTSGSALFSTPGRALEKAADCAQDSLLAKSAAKSQDGQLTESAGKLLASAKERSPHFSLITANPPYRLHGSGRVPPSEMRRTALFGDQRNLDAFIRTAALNLHPAGSFCIVFPWKRRGDLLQALDDHNLKAEREMAVLSRPGAQASLILLQAKKQDGSVYTNSANASASGRSNHAGEPELPSWLAIHRAKTAAANAALSVPEQGASYQLQGPREQNHFTDEAIRFCPYLLCNA